MLKQRLITAGILIPLILLAIFQLPSLGFLLLITITALMAAWEWFAIIKIKALWIRSLALFFSLLMIVAALPLLSESFVLVSGFIFWMGLTLLIVLFAHRPLPFLITQILHQRLLGWVFATLTIVLFVYSALFIHGISVVGPQWAFYFLMTVWLTDTGGYFAGKRWGKKPLATHISPNKTIEGLIGGIVLAIIWALIAYAIGLNQQIGLVYWLLLTVLTSLVSVVGDLFESLFKRAHNIKDSGQVLPGHGGMLDRIDSVLAGAPIFAAGLWLLGF